MALVIDAFFNGKPDIVVQGENPFAGQELDPITLDCLARWVVKTGRRLDCIQPRGTPTGAQPGQAAERGL